MSYEVDRSMLDSVIALAETWGVNVVSDWNEPEGGRFIGTFKGTLLTLYTKYDSNFALLFTVVHLYGHMVQLTRPDAGMLRSIELVYRMSQTLQPDEVQCVYDYEVEAAGIGRRLLAELGSVPKELDQQYSRMFFADFHYLIDYIENGRGGPESFERFLRREPVPWRLIEPDLRPLVDLRRSPPQEISVAVL